jgi:hypothetical protein
LEFDSHSPFLSCTNIREEGRTVLPWDVHTVNGANAPIKSSFFVEQFTFPEFLLCFRVHHKFFILGNGPSCNEFFKEQTVCGFVDVGCLCTIIERPTTPEHS